MTKMHMPTATPKKLLLFYSTAASLFLIVSALLTLKTKDTAIFQILILPVFLYLFLQTLKELKGLFKKKDNIPEIKPPRSKGFFYFILVFYFVLLALGARNILKSNIEKQNKINDKKPTPTSQPLIFKNQKPTATDAANINKSIKQ